MSPPSAFRALSLCPGFYHIDKHVAKKEAQHFFVAYCVLYRTYYVDHHTHTICVSLRNDASAPTLFLDEDSGMAGRWGEALLRVCQNNATAAPPSVGHIKFLRTNTSEKNENFPNKISKLIIIILFVFYLSLNKNNVIGIMNYISLKLLEV